MKKIKCLKDLYKKENFTQLPLTVEELHKAVLILKKKGASQEKVYSALEKLRTAPWIIDESDDAILEVMDVVCGFCPKHHRIWTTDLQGGVSEALIWDSENVIAERTRMDKGFSNFL